MFPEAAGAANQEPADNGQLLDLGAKISSADCWAKNVDTRFPMTNLFIGDTRLGCKSDADEQLILHVAFQEFVKVSSIYQCYRCTSFCVLWVCTPILTRISLSSFPLQVHSIKFTEFNQGSE
jgi:hypothetical protein